MHQAQRSMQLGNSLGRGMSAPFLGPAKALQHGVPVHAEFIRCGR